MNMDEQNNNNNRRQSYYLQVGTTGCDIYQATAADKELGIAVEKLLIRCFVVKYIIWNNSNKKVN